MTDLAAIIVAVLAVVGAAVTGWFNLRRAWRSDAITEQAPVPTGGYSLIERLLNRVDGLEARLVKTEQAEEECKRLVAELLEKQKGRAV